AGSRSREAPSRESRDISPTRLPRPCRRPRGPRLSHPPGCPRFGRRRRRAPAGHRNDGRAAVVDRSKDAAKPAERRRGESWGHGEQDPGEHGQEDFALHAPTSSTTTPPCNLRCESPETAERRRPRGSTLKYYLSFQGFY